MMTYEQFEKNVFMFLEKGASIEWLEKRIIKIYPASYLYYFYHILEKHFKKATNE